MVKNIFLSSANTIAMVIASSANKTERKD